MLKSYVVGGGGGGPQLYSVSPSRKPPGSFGIWVCLGLAGGIGDLGLGFGTRA